MVLQLDEARARARTILSPALQVEIDLRSPTAYAVQARLEFGAQVGAGSSAEVSEARDLTARLNGAEVGGYDGERIPLAGLQEHNVLEVSCTLPYVTDGNGMHTVTDPADGERYVAAYTAMDIARRVIPCFDQPDLKTRFSLRVLAPEHWTVLANGPVEGTAPATGGGTAWTFGATPPISSYLFFVCGGPFASVTWEETYAGRTLPFGWHARASLRAELERDAEELKQITRDCFGWFTQAFDEPYAFADYQQVFTPGLNWGAMEFPGCVAFRDEYLFRGEPTAIQRNGRASVIAHEMAHMWFGDLVTMRWWEDSWLNESFADFMGYEVAGRAAGFSESWVAAALVRKPTAYQADRRRSTHPVAEDAEAMPDADTAFANFDMITYAKGNSLVRQLAFWLGEEDFLRGVNGFLSSHPFGNASLEDFLAALDAASERDVRGWAAAFLRTTGFDTVRVTREGEVPVLTREGSRPHRFTVTAYDDRMRSVESRVVDLGEAPLKLDWATGRSVVPNSGDEAYLRVVLDDRTWSAVRGHLGSIDSALTRALLWWVAVDAAEGGDLAVADLVAMAVSQLREEAHPVVFEGAMRLVLRTVVRQAKPGDAPELMRSLAVLSEGVLRLGDDRASAAATALAAACADAALLRSWLAGDDLPAPDQDVRWQIVRRLAALGDDSWVVGEEARDPSVSGALAARSAQAAAPAAKESAWAELISGELSNREFEAASAGFWQWDQADVVRPWLARRAPDLLDLARRSGQAMGQIIGSAAPWLPLTDADLATVRDGLAEALDDDLPTVLRREWSDSLDDLDRVIEARARG